MKKTRLGKRNRKRRPQRGRRLLAWLRPRVGRPLAALSAAAGGVRARLRLRRAPAGAESAAQPAPEPEEPARRPLDVPLLVAVLALLGLGTTLVYSSSAVFASARYGAASYFLQRHVVYGALGLVALFVGWRVDYRLYQRFAYPLLLGTLLLLVALLIPGLGTRIDGATRWFRVAGVSFQPSELAKLTLVVYLAYSLSKKRDTMRSFSIGFLPHLCVAGLVGLLVLKQPDLGTTAVLGLVTLLMLFVAGTKLSYILISLLAAAPVAYQLIVGTPWRLRRLLAFLDPWAYRHDAGYQISESLISIGSGGMWGVGLGDGKQKLFFLPAAHTDFIFAIVGEELGVVGMGAVIALFGVILVRGLRAAYGARDLFGTYLAFGITSVVGLQGLLHMAVVLGLVPTKGITLPLMSYGGSALVVTLFCMGVLLNIAERRPAPPAVKLAVRRKTAAKNRRRPGRVVVAQ